MRYIVLFLFLFLNYSGFCQSFYRFEHLTVDNGLSSNTVTCVVQDKHDFLWFGTFNGLNRYDGYTFKVYKTSLRDTTKISNNRIVRAAKDSNGDIWFLTFDDTYNKYNYSTDNFKRYSKDELSEDELKLFSKSQLSVNINQKVVWKRVRSRGLQRQDLLTGETTAYYNDPFDNNSLSDNNVNFLYLDNSEILWVGTQGKGINKLDINQKQFHNYTHNPSNENSLQDSYIREISQDNLGNIWIGIHNSGLCKIDRETNTFNRITTENGLYNNRIRDIFVDSNGNIWVGFSAQDAVQKIEPIENSITTYQHDINDSSSFNRQSTYSIYEDEFGIIWFGGFGGISKYNPETDNFKSYKQHGNEPLLSFINVRVIFQDESKNIWIGTEGGGLNKMIREFPGFDDEEISFEHYKNIPGDTNSLSNNWIYSICEDDNGILWIGTGFGLNRFDPNKNEFKVFWEESGLPDAMIFGILKDNSNNLWLSHSKGLTHFNTETYEIIRNYSKSDGLQGNQFSEDAYYKSPSGELYFGGTEGITYFYPDSIHINKIPPKIVLTSLSILNEEVKVGEKIIGRTILKESITNTKQIELDHKHRTFSIEFAALHYSNSLGNKYEYMLEGFDDTWNKVDATKRIASYSNLRGGDYTLLIKASNNDNNWIEEPIALQIRINPPIWKTWYAILIYIGIITVVVIYIIRERGKKLNKDKLILKNKIEEVQSEVDKQKEEIVLQKQELKLRATEEKDMRWYNEGLAKFSEIISKNKGNVNKLSQAIISELVNYLGADQGGVFIINDNNDEDIYFELTGSFAYDGQKLKAGRVDLQEGQIGACYNEKTILQINNLPETYSTIRSGLGKKSPRFLVLVPLKIDDDVLGVIEITSFLRIKGVKIVFLEKLSENITAVLATERATEKMQILFKKSQEQADTLTKKEEEMRLALEEVQAANEEAKLRETELTKKIEEKEATIAQLQNKKTK